MTETDRFVYMKKYTKKHMYILAHWTENRPNDHILHV